MSLRENRNENNCISAPGLAIHGASSPLVKYSNTFTFKANGRISASVTTADAPSLSGATTIAPYVNGVATVAGNLANLYSRIYTLVATLPITGTSTAAPTFSWLAGADFLTTSDRPNEGSIALPNQSNQTVVGTVQVDNNSGAAFVPGTTNLDAAGLTVTYTDNYAQIAS